MNYQSEAAEFSLKLDNRRNFIPDLTVAVPTSITVQWSSVSFDVTEVIPRDCGIFDFACQALGDIVRTVTRLVQYPSGISIHTQNLSLAVPDLPGFNVPFPGFFNQLRNGLNNLFAEFFDIFGVFETRSRRSTNWASRCPGCRRTSTGW